MAIYFRFSRMTLSPVAKLLTRLWSSNSTNSSCLGADPALVASSISAAHRVLSGAYSRETLVSRSHGRGFSAHEMRLASSCCVYGRQKWRRSLTIVCVGGRCGVELLDGEFKPPGSGRLVFLAPGESVSIPPGQAYYLVGHSIEAESGQSRLLMLAVPGLEATDSADMMQDSDGSYAE